MLSPRYCKRCQGANPPNGKFCHYCGSSLQSTGLSSQQSLLIALVVLLVGLPVLYGIVTSLLQTKAGSASTSVSTTAGATPTPTPALTAIQRLEDAKALVANNSKSESLLQASRSRLLAVIPNDPYYKEAQAMVKTLDARIEKVRAENAPATREALQVEYERTVASANPQLNYIGSKMTRSGKGYALWATHEFFSQYTLSMGDDAHIISSWISANQSKLKSTGIVRVGVMGEGPYASWSYFDVK